MLYQIQYRIRGRKPTRQLIDRARNAYAYNRPLPQGVKIKPLAWLGDLNGLKRGLRRHEVFLGNAGIVKEYYDAKITLCDFDTDWRPSCAYIRRLAEFIKARATYIREDRTKHGWHMMICWNRSFTPLEQVAIQLALGSDVQRETYNLARVMSGKRSKRWNLLFERKL